MSFGAAVALALAITRVRSQRDGDALTTIVQSCQRLAARRGSECLSLSALLVVAACELTSSASSAAGYAVESVAPGRRVSAVIVSGDTAFSARDDGAFAATRISTGALIWSTPVRALPSGWVVAHIAFDNNRLYVGASGDVVALRRGTGEVQWRFVDPTHSLLPETAIETDGQYVAFAQNGGTATVLSASTGARVWQRALLPADSRNWVTCPVFVDGILIYSRRPRTGLPPQGEQIAFGVRASNGDSLWTLTVDSTKGLNDVRGVSSVRFEDGVLLGTQDGLVLNVQASNGVVRWRNTSPAGGIDERRMALPDAELIVTSGFTPGRLQSINPRTGAVNWTVPSPSGSPATDVAANSRMAAFTAFGSQLVLVDRTTRSARFIEYQELKINGEGVGFLGTPAFSGDRIVVATSVGLLTLRPQ